MLKNAIRSVLPAYIMRLQDNLRGRHALNRTKTNLFNASNLRPIELIDLVKFRQNPIALAAWPQDHNEIGLIFGNGEYNLAVSPNCRKALYYLIMNLRPKRVLEIGTNVGGSTLYIAAAMKRLEDGGTITTVDIVDVNNSDTGPWIAFGLKNSPEIYAHRLGLNNIDFTISHSIDYMNAGHGTYDFIFLDGDHAPAVVYDEICAALRILNRDGVILLHDYYPFGKRLRPDRPAITGPFSAVERIRRENQNITVLPLSKLLGEDGHLNITSLAVLGRKSVAH